jgi:pyrimidine-nucleoside phosphorylase
MYDLIEKKRGGGVLTEQEIREMISGYVKGAIPDYQMAAMLMAVYFRGMTNEETTILTDAVAHSGSMVDLSGIEGIKVDKHSTGGVGDKTTLVAAPIAAACGAKVAKMSGRGLGHTGGTVDKLESIPGFRTSLSQEEFFAVVHQAGLSVIGQSGNLAPADKMLYALRDVTATVDSIPLIAASVMSKKLAAGSDCILLDVKTGSGAFMKTLEDSIALAQTMVAIGENAGRRTAALITNMDIPLGCNIGNALEVVEAVDTLQGKGPADLTEVGLSLAANMLYLAGKGTLELCRQMAEQVLHNGEALGRLVAMVEAQGGDSSVIRDTGKFAKAPYSMEVPAEAQGYVTAIDTEACGIASVMLGAGRETVESVIDFSAGIILHRKPGDAVKPHDSIATLYASDEGLFAAAAKRLTDAYTIGKEQIRPRPLVFARVEKDNVERFS